MSFVGNNVMRWIRGAAENQVPRVTISQPVQRIERHSSGLAEFMRRIAGEEKLSILDLGPTSPANIPYFAQRGIRLYNEDLLRASQDRRYQIEDDGPARLDVERFFQENLNHGEGEFDAVLCWDVADYLPEATVKPMVEKVHHLLKPGGTMLAFFHTRDAGPGAHRFRYNIVQHDTIELSPGPPVKLERVFNNRHVENLLKAFSSLKFFLGRDQIREVLVVR